MMGIRKIKNKFIAHLAIVLCQLVEIIPTEPNCLYFFDCHYPSRSPRAIDKAQFSNNLSRNNLSEPLHFRQQKDH